MRVIWRDRWLHATARHALTENSGGWDLDFSTGGATCGGRHLRSIFVLLLPRKQLPKMHAMCPTPVHVLLRGRAEVAPPRGWVPLGNFRGVK